MIKGEDKKEKNAMKDKEIGIEILKGIQELEHVLKPSALIGLKQFKNLVSKDIQNIGNMMYLDAIYKVISSEHNVSHIFKTVHFDGGYTRIDVCAGNRWIKVKASGMFYPKDYESSSDDDEPRLYAPPLPIVRQMQSMIKASKLSPIKRHVVLKCIHVDRIDPTVEKLLLDLGVMIEFGAFVDYKPTFLPGNLNLDVNTLVAMVSDFTHRPKSIIEASLDNIHLKNQAKSEANEPLLPHFMEIFKNKKLVATLDAVEKFIELLHLAGPTEFKRACSLFDQAKIEFLLQKCNLEYKSFKDFEWRVEIIPNDPDQQFLDLKQSRLKLLHKNIFGSAHKLGYTTVTANHWIFEYLESLKLPCSIHVHEPRSLIEQRVMKFGPCPNQ